MLVSEDEFMVVKDELVESVLTRIRIQAEYEAKLLFRENKNYPGSLPHFSERISNAINAATDACADALADQQHGDELFDKVFPVIRDNLPKFDEMAWDRAKTVQDHAVPSVRAVGGQGCVCVMPPPPPKRRNPCLVLQVLLLPSNIRIRIA
jgi:hypothetical protein